MTLRRGDHGVYQVIGFRGMELKYVAGDLGWIGIGLVRHLLNERASSEVRRFPRKVVL
jgi:hypothetical protein